MGTAAFSTAQSKFVQPKFVQPKFVQPKFVQPKFVQTDSAQPKQMAVMVLGGKLVRHGARVFDMARFAFEKAPRIKLQLAMEYIAVDLAAGSQI